MKNILIINNSPVIRDININKLSLNNICEGSGRLAYMLYLFLSNNYNIYWVSTEIQKSLNEIKHINELNYNINYDIIFCVNHDDRSHEVILKLKDINKNCKCIFIAVNSYYDENTINIINNTYDKIVFISKFGERIDGKSFDDDKKFVIPCIVNFDNYNNVNLEDKKNKIIISYHYYKGNIDIFIKEIFPLILNKIKDVELVIATPIYNESDYDEVYNMILNNSNEYTINHIKFLGCLPQNELFKQYKEAKVAFHYGWVLETFGYNVVDQLMHNVHPITSFNDSCEDFVTDEYIKKFKYNEKFYDNYDFWANVIVDRILNYDKYFYMFNDIHNHIIKNFNYDTIANKYNDVINSL